MAPTPSSTKSHTPHSKSNQTLIRTPHSKHRLNFGAKENPSAEHPVEVIGRIRDNPEPESILQINPNQNSLRVKTEIGYRDFSLDGVSSSENEDLDGFYKKFIEPRINGVKLGAKCTIMMYGPTGSGKSYTMFGCAKQPGIVYMSLKGILGNDEESEGVGSFVQVTVLEIYNEEIYDLLATNGGGGFGFGWSKGNSSKVRLEVMGKKAKNASFISGTEAGKISKEIQKVEKRRIIKSTLCNERSSRSHCMIILDVPTVGGRLMLVDMAGSENIEQAGQIGFEAKMQTSKINQGNTALKRVVESIANGDSHVPFRDSKLTMLLQDSFEDDKSKILMILCASPDPKEIHKTISTLEYGAKAKCIVRGPLTPIKDKNTNDESFVAINQFVLKLQMENKIKEKERIEAHKELMKKEEEISNLKAKLAKVEEKEIDSKVNERTLKLKLELEKKITECEKMASEFVELEKRKMEEKMLQQQQEVEFLRRRLEEIELELRRSKEKNCEKYNLDENKGNGFGNKLLEMYVNDEDESSMIKSMDLSKSMDYDNDTSKYSSLALWDLENTNPLNEENDVYTPSFVKKVPLSTVFEDEEENEENEVQKEVIEEKTIHQSPYLRNESKVARDERIKNIFTLCGSYRELSSNPNSTPKVGNYDNDSKENSGPFSSQFVSSGDEVEVSVKWEGSKGQNGDFITTLKVVKDATLADLRKLIEIHLGTEKSFDFLALGDHDGTPLSKEKESTVPASKLPMCNESKRHLASLRPIQKGNQIQSNQLPFSPLQNILNVTAAR